MLLLSSRDKIDDLPTSYENEAVETAVLYRNEVVDSHYCRHQIGTRTDIYPLVLENSSQQ